MSATYRTVLEETRRLLRSFEQARSRNGSPRDLVEQVRHVLAGGLSDDERRALLNTVETALARLVADDALLAGDKPEGPVGAR